MIYSFLKMRSSSFDFLFAVFFIKISSVFLIRKKKKHWPGYIRRRKNRNELENKPLGQVILQVFSSLYNR